MIMISNDTGGRGYFFYDRRQFTIVMLFAAHETSGQLKEKMTAGQLIKVVPSERDFTPTFAGFCLLLTYVVVVTNLLGEGTTGPCAGHGPNKTTSFDSVTRRHTMASYIDPETPACTDFFDHACGRYLHEEPLAPWKASQLKMTNRLRETGEYTTCTTILGFWDRNSSVQQAAIGINISAADNPVDDWAMARGFAVNGVIVRLGILTDAHTYAPMLIADSGTILAPENITEAACDCLPHPVVISYGDDGLCEQLCTPGSNGTFTLKIPLDIPTDCTEAVKTFRMAASAPVVVPAVTAQLEKRFRRIEKAGNMSNVSFYVGGGRGHIPDVEWGATVVDTWTAYAQAWNRLWGSPIDRYAWPMSGWEANALYSAEQHAVFLLSGVLEPPFYSPQYDDALLRGGIDFIMAHELGHAYDHIHDVSDTRRRLIDDLVRLSQCNRTVIEMTEHEDYADRYAANVISRMASKDLNHLLNTTVYQFAQMWCGYNSDTFDGRDVHAPSKWRVNQTVQQLLDWNSTFCQSE